MTPKLKRNALFVAGLAMFFWWAFEFAKHDSELRIIIPFGDDPYDAVSSFGALTSLLLALVSLTRSYLPRWVGYRECHFYVLRTQAAVAFCVLVTVAAESVAMARHSYMWMGKHGSGRLLATEATLSAIAVIILYLLKKNRAESRVLWQPAIVWLTTLFILAIYPERWILGTIGHMVTVIFGAVFLFAPVSALVKAWLPKTSCEAALNQTGDGHAPRYIAFATAVAIGVAIGAVAYVAEVSEDAVRPALPQILFVGSVFIVLGASGISIGFAFLGRLLGFGISRQAAP